jgi:hypothetical protein
VSARWQALGLAVMILLIVYLFAVGWLLTGVPGGILP